MKYTPHMYAQVFSSVFSGTGVSEKEQAALKRFVSLLCRNGDIRKADRILFEVERAYVRSAGGRCIVIKTARRLSDDLQEAMRSFTTVKDIVEERIVPSLIAGVKIIVDGEREFDGSLKRKLEKMFS